MLDLEIVICESGPRLFSHQVGTSMKAAAIATRAFGAALSREDCSIETPPVHSAEWQEQKFGLEKACGFWMGWNLPLTPEAVMLMQRYGVAAAAP